MIGRWPLLVGVGLILVGLGFFLWKVVVLELPVTPTSDEGPWRVELEVTVRGDSRGSVHAALPSTGASQVIFDETTSADRLVFTIRTQDDARTGIWSGRLNGLHELVYGFRVDVGEAGATVWPVEAPQPPPKDVLERHGVETTEYPVGSPEVAALMERLDLSTKSDAAIRQLFAFVADEVAESEHGSEDALLTLSAREGRPEGRVRLLVTLLRAAGIPARPVAGLRLRTEGPPTHAVWTEAWLDRSWIPLALTEDAPGLAPEQSVLLRTGGLGLVEATGVEAVSHRWRALREHLRSDELATMMVPANPILARLSLYRLPVESQGALRALLLLPLGALVVAVFRNVIGVPTFGTFMPILIALALRSTALGPGLVMVATVIAIGLIGRLALENLRLLLVPRLGFLLCVVVLVATGLALIGNTTETQHMFGGLLLPIVILTMLIERISVSLAEEGTREALIQAFWSTMVAVAAYPLFTSTRAEHLMFGFPELVVVVMGMLIIIGGYTGYRVFELIRFRGLADPEDA